MPHYRNGRVAKEGDIVIGTTYNRKGTQIGIISNIKPQQDTCNCTVTTKLDPVSVGYGTSIFRVAQHENGYMDMDYGECKSLLHIDDYIGELLAMTPVGEVETENLLGSGK